MATAKAFYDNDVQMTTPNWLGTSITNDGTTLPGGIRLDPAAFAAEADGKKRIYSGQIVGRTYAERDAGTAFGPVTEVTGTITDEEIYINLYDQVIGLGMGEDTQVAVLIPDKSNVVYENFLPNWNTLTAAQKAWVRNNHTTIIARP